MTNDAKLPLPLSLTRDAGDLVFVSGQIGADPVTGKIVDGGVAGQTRQVLENLERVLATAELSLADVVKTTVFLKNPTDFDAFNAVYRVAFDAPFPTRSTVVTELVWPELLVEIEAVAVRGKHGGEGSS